MAQISRPFQLALVVVVLLAGLWLFAFQGHSSSPSATGSDAAPVVTSTVSPSPSSAAGATHSGAPAATHVASRASGTHHSAVPGLQGLTRDVAKARQAAGTPQREARELQAKAAAGTAEAASPASHTVTHSSSATARPSTSFHASTPSKSTSSHASTPSKAASAGAKAPATGSHAAGGGAPANQVLVERALQEGKIAVILFWNPHGSDDALVAQELQRLQAIHQLVHPYAKVPAVRRVLEKSGEELTKSFAVFKATANQVTSFGTITTGLQVYSTPTLLFVDKQGKTIVLTGLQDAFSIEQAIDEARAA